MMNGISIHRHLQRLSPSQLSARAFVIGLCLFPIDILLTTPNPLAAFYTLLLPHVTLAFLYLGIVACLSHFILRLFTLTTSAIDTVIRGFLLGLAISVSLVVTLSSLYHWRLGLYVFLICLFHWSDFFVVAVSNPDTVTTDSYNFPTDKRYYLLFLSSLVEYTLTYLLITPSFLPYMSTFGFCLCVLGEVIRKVALIRVTVARYNIIGQTKRPPRGGQRELIQQGVYSWCRHPGSLGWLLWICGTQLILGNIFCTLVFTMIGWIMIRDRIRASEVTLVSRFGEEYLRYQNQVFIGIPFIKGYTLHNSLNSTKHYTLR